MQCRTSVRLGPASPHGAGFSRECGTRSRDAAAGCNSLARCSFNRAVSFALNPSTARRRVVSTGALADVFGVAASQSLLRDIGASGFTAVGSLLWVKIFDLLCSKGFLEQKLSRKLVHITTGPIFSCCWMLFSQAQHARYIASLVPMLNCARLLSVGAGITTDDGLTKSLSRENRNEELLGGPLYYTLVMTVVTIAFWRESSIGYIVLATMCGGDGLADVVGRRIGKNKLPYNKEKSFEGSLAMLLGGCTMAFGLLLVAESMGFLSINSETFILILWSALAATMVESLPITTVIDDNLSVPVVTAVVAISFAGLWPAMASLGF